ncbi:MAG: hypothetical protein WKG01_30230 [Kofleriaceae bacterium]
MIAPRTASATTRIGVAAATDAITTGTAAGGRRHDSPVAATRTGAGGLAEGTASRTVDLAFDQRCGLDDERRRTGPLELDGAEARDRELMDREHADHAGRRERDAVADAGTGAPREATRDRAGIGVERRDVVDRDHGVEHVERTERESVARGHRSTVRGAFLGAAERAHGVAGAT